MLLFHQFFNLKCHLSQRQPAIVQAYLLVTKNLQRVATMSKLLCCVHHGLKLVNSSVFCRKITFNLHNLSYLINFTSYNYISLIFHFLRLITKRIHLAGIPDTCIAYMYTTHHHIAIHIIGKPSFFYQHNCATYVKVNNLLQIKHFKMTF